MSERPRPKLVVLISGSGSNLQAFIDASASGSLQADIAAVISNNPGVKGLQRAANADIPAIVLNHRDFQDRRAFDIELAELVESFQPDLVILAGFMRILTAAFVDRFTGCLLNIHPSLLPKYPGLHTHQRAIDAGDSSAGATVHFVTNQLDGGPPIIQARVPVLAGDTADTLAARVLVQEHQIYPLAAEWFCEGRLQLVNGKVLLDGIQLAENGYSYSEADALNDPARKVSKGSSLSSN